MAHVLIVKISYVDIFKINRCACSVTDIDTRSGISEPRSNSGILYSVHFRANSLEKGMDPFHLLPAMDK